MKTLIRLYRDEGGANAIEYSLIATLISIAAVAGMSSVGTNVQTMFNTVAGDL